MRIFKNYKKYWIAALLVLVIAVGGARLLHKGPFHESPVVTSGSSFNTKGEKNSGSTSAKSTSGNPSTSSKVIGSTGTLFTPSGDFVSNHHPNLSGTPAPNTMSSVCNTTPGATCKITFSKDGVTKELSAKTTDVNGSAFWNWKLQDVGLGAGDWKVQAVASLNGDTKTASDSLDLVVAP